MNIPQMRAVGLALLALSGAPALGKDPAAQPKAPAWSQECVKSEDGAKTACFVQQFVLAMPQNTVMLKVVFGYLGPEGKPRVILTAPLGVLLEPGLTLKIDSRAPLSVPFDSCPAGGCRAVIDMDKDALDSFLKGQILTVTYVNDERKLLDLPITLPGLAAAMASLRS